MKNCFSCPVVKLICFGISTVLLCKHYILGEKIKWPLLLPMCICNKINSIYFVHTGPATFCLLNVLKKKMLHSCSVNFGMHQPAQVLALDLHLPLQPWSSIILGGSWRPWAVNALCTTKPISGCNTLGDSCYCNRDKPSMSKQIMISNN